MWLSWRSFTTKLVSFVTRRQMSNKQNNITHRILLELSSAFQQTDLFSALNQLYPNKYNPKQINNQLKETKQQFSKYENSIVLWGRTNNLMWYFPSGTDSKEDGPHTQMSARWVGNHQKHLRGWKKIQCTGSADLILGATISLPGPITQIRRKLQCTNKEQSAWGSFFMTGFHT